MVKRMTLVAALRVEGVPLLLGDVLVTTPAKGGGHGALPTGPKPTEIAELAGANRIVDKNRKLTEITEQFVVGWLGDRESCVLLIRELRSRFGSGGATRAALDSFFQWAHLVVRHQCALIGWLVEGED